VFADADAARQAELLVGVIAAADRADDVLLRGVGRMILRSIAMAGLLAGERRCCPSISNPLDEWR
jgi:hypothetical protein